MAIGEVFGLDAHRPETWYRDPPLAWDIVPMWAIRRSGTFASIHAARGLVGAMGTPALLVTLDRCRFTPPWRDAENPPLSLHWVTTRVTRPPLESGPARPA